MPYDPQGARKFDSVLEGVQHDQYVHLLLCLRISDFTSMLQKLSLQGLVLSLCTDPGRNANYAAPGSTMNGLVSEPTSPYSHESQESIAQSVMQAADNVLSLYNQNPYLAGDMVGFPADMYALDMTMDPFNVT